MSEPTDQDQFQRIAALIVRFVGYLIYIYLVIVEIILTLGFFLLLFGANPSSGFVEWIYRSVERAMRPFRGIFEPIELGTGGNDVPAIFDTSILFAMIIYGILAIALNGLLQWLTGRINRIDRENRLRAQQAEYEQAVAAQHGYPAMTGEGATTGSQPVPSASTPVPTGTGTVPTTPSGTGDSGTGPSGTGPSSAPPPPPPAP